MRSDREAVILFLLCLAAVAVLFGTDLESFPNYFVADEAVHPVEFERLAENGWRAIYEPHESFPAYFRNVFKYNLSLSVYAHGIAEWIFGRGIGTLRGLSVAACVSAAAALALLLRRAGLREWWIVLPLSACVPTWLLHARTGYEVTMTAGCFGWFLYFYHRYRTGDAWCILPAMLAGAGTFYGYANGQGLMLAAGGLLFLVDARWHWRNRGWAGVGLVFAVVLFLPYLRFRWQHPEMIREHFRDLVSYVNEPDLTVLQKASFYIHYYFSAMSPRQWFQAGVESIIRHDPAGLPNAHVLLAPLVLAGLVTAWKGRGPAVTLLLIAWCAGPASAALAGISSNRILPMVLPLVAAAAAGWTLLAQSVRTAAVRSVLRWGGAGGLLLLASSIQLHCRAVSGQQTDNFGLFGMQWGAQQIFRDALPRHAAAAPAVRILVSHTWANNPDVFLPYFGWSAFSRPGSRRVEMLAYGQWANEDDLRPTPADLVVIPADEYEVLRKDPTIAAFQLRERLRAPSGRVQFFIGSVSFRPDRAEIRRREKAALTAPVHATMELCGGPAEVQVGGLDGAPPIALLQPGTRVVRAFPDVPISVRIDFAVPRDLDAIVFEHWENGHVTVEARAFGAAGELGAYRKVSDISEGAAHRETWRAQARGVTRVEISVTGPPQDIVHIRRILLQGSPSQP